ncbi:MAG: nucleotide sugar dehydrogenase, partial [Nitrososphaerota archaeon]|nr:nucleotide sugar dehydrogenase [Nitrososphaerota archaeon]
MIGLGYVGLPTAVVFAYKGYDVIGVDLDSLKVESINRGVAYIKEPNLSKLLTDTISSKKFNASTSIEGAIRECDVALICVPTPVKKGIVDLSHIINVLQTISKNLRRDMLIVIESTVPPGTTCGLAKKILEDSGLRAERDFYLAHVPERIAPGKAIQELLYAPRVVGGVGPKSTKRAMEVYSKINTNLLATDATTAEFVKLIENTYRDMNIAFANLLALIAERLGIDVYEAIKLANT